MKVALSAPAKYHFFELGRELVRRNCLSALMTGYPAFKLKHEVELGPYFCSLPWAHLPYRFLASRFNVNLEYWDKSLFDRFASKRVPECDVFMGIAASMLFSSRAARDRGAKVVVDRPCSHIEVQNRLIQEEAKREGYRLKEIDSRVRDREMAEYSEADLITVPSLFSARSFYAQGFPEEKIRVIPYGVDLTVFFPTAQPDPSEFIVVYAGQISLRKGIVHLIRAFEKVKHANKKLILIGSDGAEPFVAQARQFAQRMSIELPGHVPQTVLRDHMSRATVFVLPSIEDGYGLVMTQAMACGCPVVATTNTGADMLITEGTDGYIVPPADDQALFKRLQALADSPELRSKLSTAALTRAQKIAGWTEYGDQIVDMFQELTDGSDSSPRSN
ncbi:MAG: glycosyltransferase family 4 protein [Chthonomonadaceae bacterium]|nr:glycosyltransferase family 4 protein [Chthonomonadaceae bacterium]